MHLLQPMQLFMCFLLWNCCPSLRKSSNLKVICTLSRRRTKKKTLFYLRADGPPKLGRSVGTFFFIFFYLFIYFFFYLFLVQKLPWKHGIFFKKLTFFAKISWENILIYFQQKSVSDFHPWKIKLSIEKIDPKSHSKDWLFHSLEFREWLTIFDKV